MDINCRYVHCNQLSKYPRPSKKNTAKQVIAKLTTVTQANQLGEASTTSQASQCTPGVQSPVSGIKAASLTIATLMKL